MASICIFCGGNCGRVCRGLGFKQEGDARQRSTGSAQAGTVQERGSTPLSSTIKSSDRSDEAKAREEPRVSGRQKLATTSNADDHRKRNQAGVGSERTKIRKSGAAVGSRGGTVTGTAGSDKERESPEVRRGYNGPPSEPIRKRGRPRIGETRDKPWEAAGMSERTWYRRRQKEQNNGV